MFLVFIGVQDVRDVLLPKYWSEFCWPSPAKNKNEKWVFIEKSMCNLHCVRDKKWEKWPQKKKEMLSLKNKNKAKTPTF